MRRGLFFRGDLFIVVGVVTAALSLLILIFVAETNNRLGDMNVPWWRGQRSVSWLRSALGRERAPTLEQASHYAANINWTRRRERRPSVDVPRSDATDSGHSNSHHQHQHQHQHRYVHVISPYRERDPMRRQHQELVMASLEVARAWMRRMRPDVHVTVLTVEGGKEGDAEDGNSTSTPRRPASFASSVTALAAEGRIKGRRQLPPLRAILAAALAHGGPSSSFTHVVYTNMDILVLPHFYAAVDAMSHCGFGNFFVNRCAQPPAPTTALTHVCLPPNAPLLLAISRAQGGDSRASADRRGTRRVAPVQPPGDGDAPRARRT